VKQEKVFGGGVKMRSIFLLSLFISLQFFSVYGAQGTTLDGINRADRHTICMQALDKFFMKNMSHKEIKNFLLAQYEITTAKAFSLMLIVRVNDQLKYSRKETVFKPAEDYLNLIKMKIVDLSMMFGRDPDFVKAQKTFMQNPMSVKAYAQIAPFLERYAQKEGIYSDEITSHLFLDSFDTKMFDLLSKIEENTATKDQVNLMSFMQWATISQIGIVQNALATVEVSSKILVQQNVSYIENILHDIQPPKGCEKERWDIYVGDMDCIDCYDNSTDSIYSLLVGSEEVAKLLFNAALKRHDLEFVRKEKFHWQLYHIGNNSPWGNIMDGVVIPPEIRMDPEN
jgi:hypothetical protein